MEGNRGKIKQMVAGVFSFLRGSDAQPPLDALLAAKERGEADEAAQRAEVEAAQRQFDEAAAAGAVNDPNAERLASEATARLEAAQSRAQAIRRMLDALDREIARQRGRLAAANEAERVRQLVYAIEGRQAHAERLQELVAELGAELRAFRAASERVCSLSGDPRPHRLAQEHWEEAHSSLAAQLDGFSDGALGTSEWGLTFNSRAEFLEHAPNLPARVRRQHDRLLRSQPVQVEEAA